MYRKKTSRVWYSPGFQVSGHLEIKGTSLFLMGFNPWGHKRVGHNLVTKQQ